MGRGRGRRLGGDSLVVKGRRGEERWVCMRDVADAARSFLWSLLRRDLFLGLGSDGDRMDGCWGPLSSFFLCSALPLPREDLLYDYSPFLHPERTKKIPCTPSRYAATERNVA
jgi:hypothetical protein